MKGKLGDQGAELAVLMEILADAEGVQLRTEQSKSSTAEEDSFMAFSISMIEIDAGAIAVGDIDITGMTAVMEKSTGGAAFSAAGITQPAFAPANGLVSDDYRFLTAEWINGDVYKLTVSGIEAEVNGETVFIKDMIWSNMVVEAANLGAQITAIDAAIMELTETGDTITTDGTEQDLYINNAPAGLYQPLIILIDFTNHTAGETIEIKEYYRILNGGALIPYKTTVYAGAIDPLLVSHDLLENRFGIQVTIEKTGGANRDYDWEVIYKI